MSAVAAALGVSRPHLSSRQRTAPRRRGRPPLPDAGLVAAIQTLIAELTSEDSDPLTLAIALVNWANAQGGKDNVSVALARV